MIYTLTIKYPFEPTAEPIEKIKTEGEARALASSIAAKHELICQPIDHIDIWQEAKLIDRLCNKQWQSELDQAIEIMLTASPKLNKRAWQVLRQFEHKTNVKLEQQIPNFRQELQWKFFNALVKYQNIPAAQALVDSWLLSLETGLGVQRPARMPDVTGRD